MRDIALSIIIFGAVPFILRAPFVGVLFWTWLAYFNPQKMTYGFGLRMPFSQVIGGVTLLAWLFNRKEPKKLPMCGTTVVWVLFILWMLLTTIWAVETDLANTQLEKVLKIQIFALVTVIVTNSWERVRALVWCIVLSIGYFSIKGGIWVIKTGGSAKVWGPADTFIAGNNELALATLMTIPLAYFLYTTESRLWVKRALIFGMALSALSVAGSFSRGAMLAAGAMSLFLVWHSKSRFSMGSVVLLIGITIFAFMPDSWTERMHSVKTYEQDGSALKRLNTWTFAWNFTLDNPILGGGYNVFQSEQAYIRYAPRYDEGWIFQDAHSNYLKVLAEHGFPGLVLFLLIFAAAWRRAGKVQAWARGFGPDSEQHKLGMLAKMLQTSIIAYMVGGTFLGLCYFDLPYNIVGLIVVLGTATVQASVVKPKPAEDVPATAGLLRRDPRIANRTRPASEI